MVGASEGSIAKQLRVPLERRTARASLCSSQEVTGESRYVTARSADECEPSDKDRTVTPGKPAVRHSTLAAEHAAASQAAAGRQ